MNLPGTLKKIGATPAKLAVVGVLGVVFLAVVVPQLRGKSSGMAAADSRRTKKTKSKEQAEQQPEKPVNPSTDANPKSRAVHEWTKIPFEQIVSYDPLAAPGWFVEAVAVPEITELDDDRDNAVALADLEKQGANIVVIANQRRIASIGSQTVRVGDLIEGYQVSNITTEGVVLTELRSNSSD